MNRKKQVVKYILSDFFGSALAWAAFHYFRKRVIEPQLFGEYYGFEVDPRFLVGLVVIPAFWVFLFYFNGFYRDVYRKSRLRELGSSIWITFSGVLIIFFLLLLDDYIATYKNYYQLFLSLLTFQFVLTYFPRLLVTSSTNRKIHTRKLGYPTLIVGDGEKALELYNELESQTKSQGNIIVGYVSTGSRSKESLAGITKHLGDLKLLRNIVFDNSIEEVLIALETSDHRHISKVMNGLIGMNVHVKAIPSLYDYLTGRVKMSSIFGAPLMQLSFELMPTWQEKVKQIMDITISFVAIIILLPLFLILASIIKITSKGPIFHKQERIGKYGRPFILFKLRSMYLNAEAGGPALSSKHDNRVTPLGRFMRKTRLDEIPNFINVLKGDMSLVGPRPERQFFIDQIVKKAPHYLHLQKVKPGITSWGQVKFGYAENVDQMVERLKYDLLYLENMSLFVDLKIIIYTLITVFRGKGV
ncbi:MAG TPA: sugar transferase [Tenuifilaceae bacterium]|nr:sugar transferase [Tenuifilaceae bacterium]HPE19406.1 sugar transferase [Tenuifilaceae bacterium]HPJ46962.1 sugar transferase [Tenuifilaceae bacterium]HPQ35442.1 sugar transferase [Tenuifilaceae bacterium]HRX69239.1 sugar transferase [Tenuifilaceae bacterium]